MTKKLFLPLWIAGGILLFLYSYTQVDLSLTLSQASIFQTIQKGFQYIGWFNRPLSSLLYIALIAILFVLYLWTLKSVSQEKISRKTLRLTIFVVAGILTFSYNAFSYDIFNYIFDAKIITHYHENPYIHKALDYPGDPMLSFMRWTHRVYPYGPLWLAVTVPLSFVGGNIFIITFFLFKLLAAAFFAMSVWAIEKIAKTLNLKNPLLPVAAFALNPLVLTESLVSAHNDIVMMGAALVGVYYVLNLKRVRGGLVILFSVLVKFATFLLVGSYIVYAITKKKESFIVASIVLMVGAVALATLRTTFQPWYLLYVIPFTSIMVHKKLFAVPLFMTSILGALYYVPFLYTGSWEPTVLNPLFFGSAVLIAISFVIAYLVDHR